MRCACRLCVANTQRNIETIGLLGGSLSADGSAFDINTLIIPKQKGETDRVEMLREEELWDIFFEVHTLPQPQCRGHHCNGAAAGNSMLA